MENMSNNAIEFNGGIFKAIMERLEKEKKGKAGQPLMIVGAWGCGKSFLLRRLFEAVSSQSEWAPAWIDGRTVFSNEDLLRDSGEKRSILFVDDFHYYLQRTSNQEQFALRGLLSSKEGPILIATAPAVLPQLTNYGAAFFEGFLIYYLKTLSSEEIKRIIEGTPSQNKRAMALMDYLPKTPRAAFLVREIIQDSKSMDGAVSLLTKYVSPVYQNKFDELSPQQQRILCALSGEEKGLQLSGIRKKTGQAAGKISPYLTQMIEKGLVTKESPSVRSGVYRIADPLFGLWLPKGSGTKKKSEVALRDREGMTPSPI